MHNIEPNKKAIIAGYCAQFLSVVYGVLMLPLLVLYLNDAELTYWLILLVIMSLVFVMDFGFSPTVIRNIAYSIGGAKEIKAFGISEQTTDQVNWDLLSDILYTTKIIYIYLGLLAFVVVGGGGSWYVSVYLENTSVSYGWETWFVFLFGFILNIIYLYFTPALIGVGKIYEAHCINIITRVSWVILSVIGLVIYQEVIILAVVYVLGIAIGRVYAYFVYSSFLENEAGSIKSNTECSFILKQLLPNSWRIGVTSLSSFIINKGTILIGGVCLTTSDAASYTLTMQVISVMISFGFIYFNNYIPKISLMKVKLAEGSSIKVYFFKKLKVVLFIYLILAIVFYFLGNEALSIIGSDKYFIEKNLLLLAIAIGLLELNHSICATYLTTSNHIPFVVSAVLSAAFIVIISLWLIGTIGGSIMILLLVQGGVQLAYNNWRWPLQVIQEAR